MSFIDTNAIEVGTLLGAEHGAMRVFIFRGRGVPPGPVAAPHRHGGDEAIRVVRGRLRVRVGDELRVIGPGEIACIPPHTDHAFIVLDEADVEVFGEQRMGEFVTVRHADGTDHEEEIFVREFPWSRVPPSEDAYTPVAELLARYAEWHAANPLYTDVPCAFTSRLPPTEVSVSKPVGHAHALMAARWLCGYFAAPLGIRVHGTAFESASVRRVCSRA